MAALKAPAVTSDKKAAVVGGGPAYIGRQLEKDARGRKRGCLYTIGN